MRCRLTPGTGGRTLMRHLVSSVYTRTAGYPLGWSCRCCSVSGSGRTGCMGRHLSQYIISLILRALIRYTTFASGAGVITAAIIDTWHPTGQPVDASLYGAGSHSDVVKHIISASVCVYHETNKQKPWLRHYCAHCPCACGPRHHPVHSRYVDARGCRHSNLTSIHRKSGKLG